MGDYYRRDQHGDDSGRYVIDDDYQRPAGDRRKDGRNSPPARSRSRERYQDRIRDDYSYRGNDRSRDSHFDNRDRHRDNRDRDDSRMSRREEYGERQSRLKSPIRQDHNDPEPQAPREPQYDHQRASYEEPYDAGKPNSQVIFRGLEKDVSEADVYDFFSSRTIANFHSCNNCSTTKALLLKV
jgi:hypothetical protein